MKLFLIGLTGSGKSVLGKQISQTTELPFIDLDVEIEKQEGLSIAKIFEGRGEEYFRTVEADVLRNCSNTKKFVMATGGGTPCFHGNMDFINQTGVSIFLDAPIAEIIKRLSSKEKSKRPLLKGIPDQGLEQALEVMLNERIVFYKMANFRVNGAETSTREILEIVQFKK